MAVAIAKMDNSSTNTTAYSSDALQAPYELVRSDRFEQLIRRMSFPESYMNNSKRESSCLLFVETFRSQYSQLFPSRPQLLLSPLNECNTQKFISTFVRPTQLKYEELYDATVADSSTSSSSQQGGSGGNSSASAGHHHMNLNQTFSSTQRTNAGGLTIGSGGGGGGGLGATNLNAPSSKLKQLQKLDTEKGIAKFLANFVVYEPLEENDRVPTKIVSPATVLEWQVANSIELSITLCSLLCGTGYNAYVVIGRATREIVECDRTQNSWDGRLPAENNSDDDVPPPEPRTNRFWQVMKQRPKFESTFDKKMDETGVQNELYMMSKRYNTNNNNNPNSTIINNNNTTYGGMGMTFGGTASGGGFDGGLDATTVASQRYGSGIDQGNNNTISGLNRSRNNNEDGGDSENNDEIDLATRTISPLVHAWVVILPGGMQSKKRPVEQIICIEPSTGNTFALNDSRYHAVETVFNHMNCFVNMNPSSRPQDLKWDMYSLEEWESVFLTDSEVDNTARREKDSSSSGASLNNMSTRGGGGKSDRNSNNNNNNPNASTLINHHHADGDNPLADLSAAIANASWAPNDGGDLSLDLPASWVAPLTLSPAQLANRYPTRATGVQFADARVTRFAEYADPQLRVMEVRVPDDQDPRLEQVHTFYRHRLDLLRRKSEYPSLHNKPGSDPLEEPRKIHEWFLPGRKHENRVEGLRELIVEAGKQRTMRFYWRSRDDGLAKRTELWNEGDRSANPLPRKIIEEYKGRESTDCLSYRSATFRNAPHQMHNPGMGSGPGGSHTGGGVGHHHHATNNNMSGASAPGGYPRHGQMADAAIAASGLSSGSHHHTTGGLSTGTERDSFASRPPERMAEKYCRNPKLAAEDDVAKIKFLKPLSSDGEIWVHYHYPKDCITFPYRQFPKAVERDRADSGSSAGSQSTFSDPSSAPLIVTAPFQPKPREPELREQLRRLLAREKDCLTDIRAKNDEAATILDTRKHDVRGLKAIISPYDTLRNRSNESDKDKEEKRLEELRRAQSRKDHLAPYIATLDLPDGSSDRLSIENAKIVRDSALKDLKDRLIQRGHIMQARLDQEKEELYRRQAAFQKNLDASNEGAADSEAFAKYCSDAAWRMKILDERLSRHIEEAGNRYAALARKLSEDPRLAMLYSSH